ncbi:YicC family protein [Candidatus Kapabacteria bacterium]|nr:YicC family protein [Candidatus Kapabacteria bacterium]
MIKSMTGYSKKEFADKGYVVSVEIKSLNGRNLDLNIRLPRQLNQYEIDIRNLGRSKVHRGSISLNINFEPEETKDIFKIDFDKAGAIYDEIYELNTWLKTGDKVKLDNLMSFSSMFMAKQEDEDTANLWSVIRSAVQSAFDELDKMKRKEGLNLAKDISKRISLFNSELVQIQKLGLERIPEEQDRYKEKIARLFENDEIDEQRLQTEIILMADKLDISEECVRLFSHIDVFNETMKDKEPSGRKLNFLLQEMHREINTIGTKASNSVISIKVVNLKEEIERIREQIQNVE